MPIYDFACSDCGYKKEVIQSFEDKAPECCGKPMSRSFGNIKLVFWKVEEVGLPAEQDSAILSRQATRAWEMEQGRGCLV